MTGRASRSRSKSVWLALGPALFVMATGPFQPALANDRATFRAVAAEEARVSAAVAAKDGKALSRSVATLGSLIEAALKKRDQGKAVSSCDMAAHSLGFVAASAAEGLAHSGEARRMLIDDAKAATADFIKDMQACETLNRQKNGSHSGLEKALRAL